MRRYEIMLILPPDADDRVIGGVTDRIAGVVGESGGSIDKTDVWGKRRFSYEINKQTEGLYVVVEMSAEPPVIKELDRVLGLADDVIRFKTVVREEAQAGAAAPAGANGTRSARRPGGMSAGAPRGRVRAGAASGTGPVARSTPEVVDTESPAGSTPEVVDTESPAGSTPEVVDTEPPAGSTPEVADTEPPAGSTPEVADTEQDEGEPGPEEAGAVVAEDEAPPVMDGLGAGDEPVEGSGAATPDEEDTTPTSAG